MKRRKQHRINFLFAALVTIGICYFLPSIDFADKNFSDNSESVAFSIDESIIQDSDIFAEDSDSEDSLKKKCIKLFQTELHFQHDLYSPQDYFFINRNIESAPLLIMHNLPPPLA